MFDFQILDNEENIIAVIEMQGIQHYRIDKYNPEFGQYEREVTDPLKREYCKSKNIPMFEIRYDDNIESKMEEIVKVLHANTVPRLSNE